MDWGSISEWVKEIGNIVTLILGVFGLGTAGYIAVLRRENKKHQRDEWESEQVLSGREAEIALLKNTLENSDTVIGKYQNARTIARGEELSLWGVPPGKRIEDYDERMRDSIPIMLFANLKGGVSKTTLSANIGAYFAKKDERVLLIDLDYQGSLSGLCLSQGQYIDFPSVTDQLIDGTADGQMTVHYAKPIGQSAPNLHFIPAFYPLETTEFRIMFKWFLDDTDHDVRYNLASVLLSDEVQGRFDRVILDGPPRMTPALVNALCASTHLFIPTVLDNLSAETVGSFAKKIHNLRGEVMPRLTVSGIIGTMVPNSTLSRQGKLSKKATHAAKVASEQVRNEIGGSDLFMWESFLRKDPLITNTTDEGIAYLKDRKVQPLFDSIGAEIAKRVPRKTS